MPAIATRIAPPGSEERFHPPVHFKHMPPITDEPSLSLPGNPAPFRGLVPVEFMNDADIRHFYPDGPYFSRGIVDSTVYVRNLALQALNP